MFRVMLVVTLFVLAFGWVAAMTAYKVLQVVFTIVAVIIMILVGNIVLGMFKKSY